MAAPGAFTNPNTAISPDDTNTSVAITCSGNTTDKIAFLTLRGDHSADNFTVDTAGWTMLAIKNASPGGDPVTVGVAYSDGGSDVSVTFSWDTGASYAGYSADVPDTAFGTAAPVISSSAFGAGSAPDPDSVAWTPTGTDVRVVPVFAVADARRTVSAYPEADNNTYVDAGGAGDASMGLCTAGVTADSPYDPGAYTLSGSTNWIAFTVAVLEAAGGITGSAAVTEPVDVVAASGAVAVSGTAAILEPVDSVAGTGAVLVSGTAAITEPVDTVAAAGGVLVAGTADITEPVDTVAGSGTVADPGITGSAAITEPVDTVAGVGAVQVTGTAAVTEPVDVLAAVGAVVTPFDHDPGPATAPSNTGTSAIDTAAVRLAAVLAATGASASTPSSGVATAPISDSSSEAE